MNSPDEIKIIRQENIAGRLRGFIKDSPPEEQRLAEQMITLFETAEWYPDIFAESLPDAISVYRHHTFYSGDKGRAARIVNNLIVRYLSTITTGIRSAVKYIPSYEYSDLQVEIIPFVPPSERRCWQGSEYGVSE